MFEKIRKEIEKSVRLQVKVLAISVAVIYISLIVFTFMGLC